MAAAQSLSVNPIVSANRFLIFLMKTLFFHLFTEVKNIQKRNAVTTSLFRGEFD